MTKEDKLNTKMITPVIRCMFPKLDEVDEKNGKYGLSIPLPKTDKAAYDALQEIMRNAAVNTWGEKYANLGGITHFVEDCDKDPKYADDQVYSGCLKFSAKSNRRPGCVYPNLEAIPLEQLEQVIYGGCYIRASISAYGTETGGKKTVAFSLNNVMFVKDGERLGGAPRADEDFAAFADTGYVPDLFGEDRSGEVGDPF